MASAVLALLNGMLLASERYEWNGRQRAALGRAHLVFLVGHAGELLLRAAATGTAFFAVKWNQFELCALALSLLGEWLVFLDLAIFKRRFSCATPPWAFVIVAQLLYMMVLRVRDGTRKHETSKII